MKGNQSSFSFKWFQVINHPLFNRNHIDCMCSRRMYLYKSNFVLRNVKFYTTSKPMLPIDSPQLFHKLRKLLYRLHHWLLTDITETVLLISTALQTSISMYRIQNLAYTNKIKPHSNFLFWETYFSYIYSKM